MNYEVTIGLEIHTELSTETKLFCSCSARAFGAEPNTNICPACYGMPGTLPRLNRRAVELGMKAGMLLGCEINRVSSFDKKNYFYPDLPSGYQLTQWFSPIATNGFLDIEVPNNTVNPPKSTAKRIRIKQIHVEEDAGKLIHEGAHTLVDMNRSGVPLIEIVTHPDLSSAEEVEAFLDRLRTLLRFARISGAVMAKGELRCDVNLSVRPAGSDKSGVRVELKNMNSVEAIKKAIRYETARHLQALEGNGETVTAESRGWDETNQVSFSMRSKESAADYRYFPDPNVPPLIISEDWLSAVKAELPQLPEEKKRIYTEQYGLSEYDAAQISASFALCTCFEEAVKLSKNPKDTVNWLLSEVMSELNTRGIHRDELPLTGAALGKLVLLASSGRVSRNGARKILPVLFDSPDTDPSQYAEEQRLIISTDTAMLSKVAKEAIAADPKSVSDYLSGKEKAFMALFGRCMKALNGNCDPQALREALNEELSKLTAPN